MNKIQIVLYALDCAYSVLDIYEEILKGKTPRKTINTTIAYFAKKASWKDLIKSKEEIEDSHYYAPIRSIVAADVACAVKNAVWAAQRTNKEFVTSRQYSSRRDGCEHFEYEGLFSEYIEDSLNSSKTARNNRGKHGSSKKDPTIDRYDRFLTEAVNNNKIFKSCYKTPETLGMAQEIIETRNFSLMPILADALIDLNCPEEEVEVVRSGTGLSNWALYNLGFDNENT